MSRFHLKSPKKARNLSRSLAEHKGKAVITLQGYRLSSSPGFSRLLRCPLLTDLGPAAHSNTQYRCSTPEGSCVLSCDCTPGQRGKSGSEICYYTNQIHNRNSNNGWMEKRGISFRIEMTLNFWVFYTEFLQFCARLC